jgi:hypothetical protein
VIHEVGVDLGTYLVSKKCPFPVVDGPENRPTTTFARERVVIEHDPAGDNFDAPHFAKVNPRPRLTRNTGVRVMIYAKHPRAGAIYWEHVRRAERVLDLVLSGLAVVAKQRANLVAFKSGKFIQPDDLKESETPGGAVYELLLTFDRGITDLAWDNTLMGTVTIAASGTGQGTAPGTITIQTAVQAAGATENGGTSTETGI